MKNILSFLSAVWWLIAIIAALFAAATMALGDWLSERKSTVLLLLAAALLAAGCATKKRVIETGYPGTEQYSLRHVIAPASLALFSGACYGMHETVVHHPHRLPASWDTNWWNGQISWRNKYAGGDPANGARFPGSTTALVWTTDAKHLFGSLHRASLFAAGVTLTLGERRPTWHYLADAGLSFAAFSLGFHGIYSLAFGPKQ